MDINVILQAITTVGFPIVCACALWYQNIKVMKEFDSTIERNTIALQRLLDQLHADEMEEGGIEQ